MKKLTRCNKLMFQTVKCQGYMKKVNDGRFIEMLPRRQTLDGTDGYYYTDTKRQSSSGETWSQEITEFCGDLDFLKTYYEYTEKKFVGIVVGMKVLIISSYLYVDINYENNGVERVVIGKQTKDCVKCALVYYGCNKSRFVPFDDLEVFEEN